MTVVSLKFVKPFGSRKAHETTHTCCLVVVLGKLSLSLFDLSFVVWLVVDQ